MLSRRGKIIFPLSFWVVVVRKIQFCSFVWVYWSQNWWLKCSWEWEFCGFFYALEIKEGHKEDYRKKTRQRLGYRIVTSLEGVMFISMVACYLDAQEQWESLAYGKDKPFTENVIFMPGGWLPTTNFPVRNLWCHHCVKLLSLGLQFVHRVLS